MILEEILRDCALVNDQTRITIRSHDRVPLASGNWFQDQIMDYSNSEVLDFTYDALMNRIWIRTREDNPW